MAALLLSRTRNGRPNPSYERRLLAARATLVGQTIEDARTTGASYETVKAFLELFERTRVELGI
ncbi:hypothetical protein GGP41_001370 [Bipolaris sorokiniana]|uniref:Uncharacterized protein n=1 Tax=Cochliobolus sativus TaxID=45130 RepID=A0A8H6DQA3_COCSA|nr:hypothetical protein GGP41_001370 [Bipolaris sorokiniana]